MKFFRSTKKDVIADERMIIWKCPECHRVLGFLKGQKDSCNHSWNPLTSGQFEFKVIYEDNVKK